MAITGSSFVDRPLRLLCREADGTELWFSGKPPRLAGLVFSVAVGSNEPPFLLLLEGSSCAG